MDKHVMPPKSGNRFEVVTEDGRTSVIVNLPEEPPPSNYIPMDARVLESKLAARHTEAYVLENLHVLSKRIGLRCSLRCVHKQSAAVETAGRHAFGQQ